MPGTKRGLIHQSSEYLYILGRDQVPEPLLSVWDRLGKLYIVLLKDAVGLRLFRSSHSVML